MVETPGGRPRAPLRALWGRGQDCERFGCLTPEAGGCEPHMACVGVLLPRTPALFPAGFERRGCGARVCPRGMFGVCQWGSRLSRVRVARSSMGLARGPPESVQGQEEVGTHSCCGGRGARSGEGAPTLLRFPVRAVSPSLGQPRTLHTPRPLPAPIRSSPPPTPPTRGWGGQGGASLWIARLGLGLWENAHVQKW